MAAGSAASTDRRMLEGLLEIPSLPRSSTAATAGRQRTRTHHFLTPVGRDAATLSDFIALVGCPLANRPTLLHRSRGLASCTYSEDLTRPSTVSGAGPVTWTITRPVARSVNAVVHTPRVGDVKIVSSDSLVTPSASKSSE